VPPGRPDIGGGTPPGPARCGPVPPARNDPAGEVASRTTLLPSCADTPAHPLRSGPQADRPWRAWPGRQTADQAGQPRRTAARHDDHERQLPPVPGGARDQASTCAQPSTCDGCHDPLHRQRLLRPPCPQAGSVNGRRKLTSWRNAPWSVFSFRRQARRAGGFPDVRSCRKEYVIWPMSSPYCGQPCQHAGCEVI
jgi:hypothetical protein